MLPNQQPPQQRPPMPQQQAAPPAAGAAPPQPPGAQAGAPDAVRGAQRVSNTEFNQQMQNILLSRIEEEGQKNPNFGGAIDEGVSREAALELALILPELHPIFRSMGLFDGMGDGQAAIGPRPPMQGGQPSAGPGPMPGGGQPMPEEEENPLLRDSGAVPSRGLMG